MPLQQKIIYTIGHSTGTQDTFVAMYRKENKGTPGAQISFMFFWIL